MQRECFGEFNEHCLPEVCGHYADCGLEWVAAIKRSLSLDEPIVTFTRARQFFRCPEDILDQLNCKENYHGHRYYSIGQIVLVARDEYAHRRRDVYLPLMKLELELLYLRNQSRYSQIEKAAMLAMTILTGLGGLNV